MTKNGSRVRLGVDIGGTFTDVVLEVNKTLFSRKVLTTFLNPEDGILDGINQVCGLAKVAPQHIQQVIHGTTLATNALIERNGAKTALITTKGFRDVIEMRTESRFEQYDLNLKLPEPLIPRQQRYVVEERLNASGEILIPLKYKDVEKLVEKLKDAKFESIAVGLIHSYINSCHEEMLFRIISEKMPNVMVSLSSIVSPQMREYERFNTVAANAYIKPLIKNYLLRLEKRLIQKGIKCSVFLMHSGGGIMSLNDAAEYPVRLIESGPAGGAVFAANIAVRHNLRKVLSFDMGGTTAKICLINEHTPNTSRVFEVARSYRFKKGSGMPISIPVIDMVEIGAGGGSIATIDTMKQLRVGPKSSGSFPGPVCYGNNTEEPTVTDADLVLGKLDPENFAGGKIKLKLDPAIKVLNDKIATPLSTDIETAAFGLTEVVDENMANAARVHAVETGEDLSEYTMVAFGGAAPLHASRLCDKLGIDRILVPKGAGVGSAIGFLFAPISFESNRSLFMKLSKFDKKLVIATFQELLSESEKFVRSCNKTADLKSEFKVYMRYSGQGWEIPVLIPEETSRNPKKTILKQCFEMEYKKLFGRIVENLDIEATLWAVNTSTTKEEIKKLNKSNKKIVAKPAAKRTVFEASLGRKVSYNVFMRDQLKEGNFVSGPALIIENETSIILSSNRTLIFQSDGSLDIRTKPQKGQRNEK